MTKDHITTIEGLAERIQRTMASNEDVLALDQTVQALDMKVTEGFDRIEYLRPAEQKRKIEDLEVRMKRLEDALAIEPQLDERPQNTDRRWQGGQDLETTRHARYALPPLARAALICYGAGRGL
jgi:hypothetical protein